MKGKTILFVFLGILACALAVAQELPSGAVKSAPEYIEKQYTIFFPAGVSEVVESYKGNGRTLEAMVTDLNKTLEKGGVVPDSLTIVASTSPEGPVALNNKLAIQRADNTRNLFVKLFPQFRPENITVVSSPNDWSGMVLTLRRDNTIAFRDLILKLLTDIGIVNKDVELRTKHPKAYAAIRDKMFDNMRTASVRMKVVRTEENIDEFVMEPVLPEPELTVTSESPMAFPAEGGDGKLEYKKNVEDQTIPSVRSAAGWIQNVVPADTIATFTVVPNPSKEPRSAVIAVEGYGKTYDVVVNQAGTDPALNLLSESPMHFPAEGGEGVIRFEKNVDDEVVPVVQSDVEMVAVRQAVADHAVIDVKPNPDPQERKSVVELDYYGKKYEVEVVQDPATPIKEKKPFYMAVKNNMLYDAAIVPNVGAEFYLGKNFSVAGNWMYSWWKKDKSAWYWRTYGGDLAVRYWLGKAAKEKPLTGHHVGLYGQMITYDFEVGNKGVLADRWSWSVGAEYGYSLPVAYRLNIDFTIGFGYHWGVFEEYLPIDGHYVWQATKKRQYIGPTKAEISLVWLIGHGNWNVNKKKNR